MKEAVTRGGWSITVGELKQAIAEIPDDYEVMLENAEVDEVDISNVNINRLYPPSATGSPGLLILGWWSDRQQRVRLPRQDGRPPRGGWRQALHRGSLRDRAQAERMARMISTLRDWTGLVLVYTGMSVMTKRTAARLVLAIADAAKSREARP